MAYSLILFFIFYCLFKFFNKTNKKYSKKKYKYQNAIEENVNISNESEIFDLDLFESQIKDVEKQLNEREERIASYDYREFKGRNNVPWIEVYEYLWNQCRYKGISMWIEYMRQLVKEGVINNEDISNVIKKAGDYIPWNPRLDLEVENLDFIEETRRKDKENDLFFESVNKYNEKLYKQGILSKDEYEKEINKRNKHNLDYLKIFYYEEYLKEIGRI